MPHIELDRLLRYNLVFWCALLLLEHFPKYLYLALTSPLPIHWHYLLWKELPTLLVIAATHFFIRWSYQRALPTPKVFAAGSLMVLIYIPLSNLSWIWLKDIEQPIQVLLFSSLDTNSLPFFIWGTCYLLFWRMQQQRQQEQSCAQLQQQIQQLELHALQHQLNPHFTFNTLNSLCALVESKRYEDAELMSEQLATFLRYSFSKSRDQLVKLTDELAAIEAYLTLQKIRFGDKLKVQWQIEDALKQQSIPPLLLQPLVENAVKYAVASQRQGATVCISGYRQGEQWQLAVTDDGPGSALTKADNTGSGVGLANIRDRLAQHFGEKASLITTAQPSGFQAHIQLPWQGCN